MIRELRKSGRLELTLLLSGMALFCFALSVFRHLVTHSRLFLFLNWNLFLAFIPWLASSIVMLKPALRNNRSVLIGLLPIWILFFPNSPYILTDLLHLQPRPNAPMWFDLALILSFAWTGLSYGFVSLLDIERLLLERMRKPSVAVLIVIMLFLSAFGIYLGRYQRWNSWDILHAPFVLLADIGDRFADPLSHPRTWGVTLLMGAILNMMYWTIKLIKRG